MSLWQWFQNNTIILLGGAFALYMVAGNKLPSIKTYQEFLDSFESKGGQLLLLWVTDFLILGILIRYWNSFGPPLQTTIVGLLSGVNGAFLGAIGARQTSGGGDAKPDKLEASFVPADKK